MLKKQKIRLLNKLKKHNNIKIIYITKKNELWGICDIGLKKCILKKIIDCKCVNSFINNKKLISYEESLLYNNKNSKNPA